MLPLLIPLRYLAVAGQLAAMLFVAWRLGLGIPLVPMLSVSAALLVFNIALHLWWRRGGQAGARLLLAQLLVDMAALTALLYLAGGPANPFVSLYLVPVAIAAVGLDLLPVLTLATLSALLYTGLMRWHLPLPTVHGRDFELHIVGMWINFLLTVTIMAVVLGRFMATVKRQRRALAEARERALRDESVLALGTLAAGTAHELNTPLTTMGLLLDDWRDGHAPDDEDLALMRAQLAHCRDHVRTLADLARRGDADEPMPRDADTLLRDCVDRWRLLRPSVAVSLDAGAAGHAVRVDATLPQALIHLFNNAADANARRGADATVEIASRIVEDRLCIAVRDRGDGPDTLAAFARAERGTHNLGVGLMITNASIERAGGSVRQFARDGGGCITEIALPLATDAGISP
ncbi:MAG: HAMP domain-containing histidine kinase [Xanthomonadaceae bacterium]|nr:HAMP domain-containing histidine kinase [Xanthomonadaceae bacterium]